MMSTHALPHSINIVIPAKAGIQSKARQRRYDSLARRSVQVFSASLDSRLRGNDY